MEDILFETERRQSRTEIAEYLETVADRLRSGDEFTLRGGDESVTLDVPERPEFEVKVEREGPADGPWERSLELELEWDEGEEGGAGGGDGELSIE